MYNERKDSFSIKNVIVQFLFVALFVFLLIWLFPTKSDISNLEGGESANLDVFYDRIFNENVIAMKDAAKSYFTTPRLPQKVGDKVTMTLGEMLDKKIILPFVDKDGETCSLTDSYVEITKYDEEYVMKVNLKCSEQENYLLVYMGCYDYCSTTICEKNESDVKTPVIYPTKSEPKEEPKKEEPKPVVTPTTPSCNLKVVSGEKYGDGYTGKVVVGFASKNSGDNASLTGYGLGTSTNYNGNNEFTLSTNGTHKIYGYVKNSFGNTAVCSIDVKIQEKKVTEDPKPVVTPTTPSCSLKVVSGEKYDGGYTGTVVVGFASKNSGDNATLVGYGLGTKTNYSGNANYSVAKVGTHKIYGYVKNSFGNTAVCSIDVTIKEKKEEVKEYVWEYVKPIKTCSDYSAWSDWGTNYVEPTDLRQVAYRKVKVTKITGYKTTTYNDTSKPIYGTKEVAIGKLTQKVCTEYGYEKTGEVAYTDWKYQGLIVDNGNLKANELTKYVRVNREEELCQEYCSSTTDVVYELWTRAAVSGVKYTCKNTTTVTKLITANRQVITGYETYTVKEPIKTTEIVTQYRYRTKTCDTKLDKKWSHYNDKTLLNNGYIYTGETKLKK